MRRWLSGAFFSVVAIAGVAVGYGGAGASQILEAGAVGSVERVGPQTLPRARAQAFTAVVGEYSQAAAVDPSAVPVRSEPRQVGPPLGPNLDEIIPPNSGHGRRVVYSNREQRIWVVGDNGELLKTHRVSGRTGTPVVGVHRVYSRSIKTFATHNPSIIWNYMVRFATGPNGGAVGFHEIPTQCTSNGCHRVQTDEQLGQPLSGGCLRQSTADAIWMWEWATIGTVVVVIDNG